MSEEKGVYTLVKAWRKLNGIELYIVGDGPLRAELESYCIQFGVPVKFFGAVPRDRVLELVGQAMFQIIPSQWYEGFPMVILEAFASRTPVIASKIGSLDELIIEGETGFKFEPGSEYELAATVERALLSPSQLKIMGLAAYRHFSERYTAQKNFEQLMGVYAQALSERST